MVSDRRLHCGLEPGSHADVEIHWTNGLVEHYAGVAANHLVTATEGRGVVKAVLR